jgi:hypothetical protein
MLIIVKRSKGVAGWVSGSPCSIRVYLIFSVFLTVNRTEGFGFASRPPGWVGGNGENP